MILNTREGTRATLSGIDEISRLGASSSEVAQSNPSPLALSDPEPLQLNTLESSRWLLVVGTHAHTRIWHRKLTTVTAQITPQKAMDTVPPLLRPQWRGIAYHELV